MMSPIIVRSRSLTIKTIDQNIIHRMMPVPRSGCLAMRRNGRSIRSPGGISSFNPMPLCGIGLALKYLANATISASFAISDG